MSVDKTNIAMFYSLWAVHKLDVDDLWRLHNEVAQELHQKTVPRPNQVHPSHIETDSHLSHPRVVIPGSYRMTKEEVEKERAAIFTSEEPAEIEQTDISSLSL